jgi:hypothetical protein
MPYSPVKNGLKPNSIDGILPTHHGTEYQRSQEICNSTISLNEKT